MSIGIDISLLLIYNTPMEGTGNWKKQPHIEEIARHRQMLHNLVWSGEKGITTTIKGLSFEDEHNYFYPGRTVYLDGDDTDKSLGNQAMVCPCCEARILKSRLSPKGIWLLKAKGLSYAEIGRILEVSREWIRQLCNRYQVQLSRMPKTDINDLVRRVQSHQRALKEDGKLTRLTDKRTLRKRIIAELNRRTAEGETKGGTQ